MPGWACCEYEWLHINGNAQAAQSTGAKPHRRHLGDTGRPRAVLAAKAA